MRSIGMDIASEGDYACEVIQIDGSMYINNIRKELSREIHEWNDKTGNDVLVGFRQDFMSLEEFEKCAKEFWLKNNPKRPESDFDKIFYQTRVRVVAKPKKLYRCLYGCEWLDIDVINAERIEKVKICFQIYMK